MIPIHNPDQSIHLSVHFLGVLEQLVAVLEPVDDVESVADVAADQDVVADAVGRGKAEVRDQC
jgi:hypothetical protein